MIGVFVQRNELVMSLENRYTNKGQGQVRLQQLKNLRDQAVSILG